MNKRQFIRSRPHVFNNYGTFNLQVKNSLFDQLNLYKELYRELS